MGLYGFLHMMAGEVASIAKTYRSISKCALNMYIDAYVSHVPLEPLSSSSSHTQVQACPCLTLFSPRGLIEKLSVLGTGRKQLSVLGASGDHLGPLGTIWGPLGSSRDHLGNRFDEVIGFITDPHLPEC